jgi:GT2 family glycosyltransferase
VAKAPAEKPSEVRDGKSSAFTAPSLSRGRSGDAECVTLASRVHVSPSDNEAGAIIRNARAHDFMLPLEAGDILSADALFELARAVNSDRGADFIYADERRVNIASGEVEPFLKPDWSPVLLIATNYVGRPWCARLDLLRSIGRVVFRPGAMDNFDLVLACTESASRVLHVRKLLAERGAGNIESEEAEVRALQNALRRRHLDWVVDAGRITGTYRCRPKVQAHNLVSIIICTCGARGLIKTCIEGLRARSTYKDIEVIVLDNTTGAGTSWKPWLRANADVLIKTSEPFNWSRFNNMAAGKASGSYLLFLNDDTEVIHPDWLEALLEPFASRDVAIAGPQLLYPDRRVQHAGMLLAGPALPRHAFRSHAENDPGYFGLALTQREVIAVTGACMMVRADAFREAGGFDEEHRITYNDVDFCLRMHARGLRCVYTPFARLLHHEIASREGLNEEYDREAFHRRWSGSRVGMHGDPYFHPLLDPHSDSYRPQLPVQPQRSTSL